LIEIGRLGLPTAFRMANRDAKDDEGKFEKN
jgi:hypothetical protein